MQDDDHNSLHDIPLHVGSISGNKAIIQNLRVAMSLGDQIRTTYGPRGRDKLICDENGEITVTNDGATILRLLRPQHPVAQLLVKLSTTQDVEIGDGTTGVVLICSFLCEQALELIDTRAFHTHTVIRGFKMACQYALSELQKLEQKIPDLNNNMQKNKNMISATQDEQILETIVGVPLNSKLLCHDKNFFVDLIIQAATALINKMGHSNIDLINHISIVSIPGASLQDSYLVDGIVFKRPFIYAGHEQQAKRIKQPKILLLNQEIELKHQKEFAHLMINQVSDYTQFVDTEWDLVHRKMQQMSQTGCNLILDMQGIGDLATQHFVQKGITNVSRVDSSTLTRISESIGSGILSSLEDLPASSDDDNSDRIQNSWSYYGTCDLYEEVTIGEDQYCIVSGCPKGKHMTLILRASSEETLKEAERSIHDAICVLSNALRYPSFVYGGGATEMSLKSRIDYHCDKLLESYNIQQTTANDMDRRNSRATLKTMRRQQQSQLVECMRAFGRALEELVVTLARNANLDSANILAELNYLHHNRKETQQHVERYGVNIETGKADDMSDVHVYEPSAVKKHALTIATEAACLILSIDHVVKMPPVETDEQRALRLAQQRKYEQQVLVQQKRKMQQVRHESRLPT